MTDCQALEVANIIVKNHLFFVTFTGGEPLVRTDLLVELSKYLSSNGLILSLNTSLSVFDDIKFRSLKMDRLLISCPSSRSDVYGYSTGGGNYAVFEERLRYLIDSGWKITVNMVVSKINIDTIRETAERMAVLGVKRFAATPASVNPGSPKFEILLESPEVLRLVNDLIWIYDNLGLKVDIMESIPKCLMPSRAFELELPFVRRTCRAGLRNGTISATGQVRPCSHNPLVFGNVLEENMESIWRRMKKWRENTGNVHMDCLNCDIFNSCGGGCRIDASVRSGCIDSKHPYMASFVATPLSAPRHGSLSPDLFLHPSTSFQERREDGGWLIAPGSPRNIIVVNDVLYAFIKKLRNVQVSTIGDIAINSGTNCKDPEFQRVLTDLIKQGFFRVSRSHCN